MDLVTLCSAPPENHQMVMLLGVFFFLYALLSLFTGRVRFRSTVMHKSDNPFQYWTSIIIIAIAAGLFYFPYWYCGA
jgi:hypothetical protein